MRRMNIKAKIATPCCASIITDLAKRKWSRNAVLILTSKSMLKYASHYESPVSYMRI